MNNKVTVWRCPVCGGDNTVAVKDGAGGFIYEATTHCKDCGRNNYWAHGYFEEHGYE